MRAANGSACFSTCSIAWPSGTFSEPLHQLHCPCPGLLHFVAEREHYIKALVAGLADKQSNESALLLAPSPVGSTYPQGKDADPNDISDICIQAERDTAPVLLQLIVLGLKAVSASASGSVPWLEAVKAAEELKLMEAYSGLLMAYVDLHGPGTEDDIKLMLHPCQIVLDAVQE